MEKEKKNVIVEIKVFGWRQVLVEVRGGDASARLNRLVEVVGAIADTYGDHGLLPQRGLYNFDTLQLTGTYLVLNSEEHAKKVEQVFGRIFR